MHVALINVFHAGDVIMSRAIIKRVRPLLVDRVKLEIRCQWKYRYLWEDLGLPISDVRGSAPPDMKVIDLWFSHGGDLLGVTGMTHATQVTSYNRQATAMGLPTLDPNDPPGVIDFAPTTVDDAPGVLVENGPVLSGQPTLELNGYLGAIASHFPGIRFYVCAPPPPGLPPNVIDVSSRNLIQLSYLSERCEAMIARLSAPFIASLTQKNVGRLPRLVLGRPIGCPIWDERDVTYYENIDQVMLKLREVLS